ncbi:DNA polymerase III, alpha subunit, Gram-positive type [Marvinbryantia formatexigens DSM 14469]|uniref:DNA polymerase III PolC-type n=1 Tax=Marvinbryantia formatexigens DSM 14469 TaxID=478749 RepID=C6LM98_9FIRM|nr:PolC-type DNA polymerase III [Marvinbryantia formatexigens]EET58239.1 DNA polymerase III, alpha subunit, Gram-positive type [Marvinbryantia formatexigens DSM 14469]UWO23980.1 PolC-type DNA polymerase III [Marvinbryantia formatexigens DSM 14469]SDH22610.1 DNA polymerase-3 subunit alpha [Marvinbryantia formatexigens]
MERAFTEVFPGLKVKDEVNDLLTKVTVAKVTVTSAKDFLRVFIVSEVWIHKKFIYEIEQAICDQCFDGSPITVKIIEKFHLSGQYTAQNLFPLYKDSILLELRNYSMFEYNLLRHAECDFPAPDSMHMTIEKSVIAHGKAEELIRILEKVFCERCGLSLKITLEEKEPKESRARQNSDLMIEQEVQAIADRVRKNKQAAEADELMIGDEPAAQPRAQAQTAGAPQAKKPAEGQFAKGAQGGAPQKGNGGREYGRDGGRGGFTRRSEYRRPLRQSDNPDVIYGRDFEDEPIPISSIEHEMGEVVIRGQIRAQEMRELRNEKFLMILEVTDFTDTIVVKLFLQAEQAKALGDTLKKGAFVKVKGVTNIDRFDSQLGIGSVTGIKKAADFRVGRTDTYPQKRVELHCHTKMSDMDGVSEVKDIVKQAYKWGHPAIAITDHGAVQAFPDANHVIEDIDRAYRDAYKEDHPEVTKDELKKISHPFKVLYGVEGYLVDDLQKLVTNSKNQAIESTCVVFDLETTGFSPTQNRIIEIGAVKVENGEITDRFSTFVNPQVPIPFRIEQLTSINDNMVMDAPTIEQVLPEFLDFVGDAVLAAHNASFDVSFIEENMRRLGLWRDFTYVDTVALARVLLPQLNRFKLDTVAKALHVQLQHHHRAVDDAECTAGIYLKFMEMLKLQGADTFDQVNELGSASLDQIKKLPTYHVIILAKNDVGRVNLYRLVSFSHLQYYNRRPRIPKSALNQYREGLIVGSACEAGELFRAVLEGKSEPEIARIVDFYDYLEIQPIGNNAFLLKEDNDINSEEDLRELNRKIVRLGEQFNKPVVATCDVHFLNPEDEIYRRIIMAGKGFKDADEQAPLFLRTTEEMLKEFAYLGSEKAEEVVITNTNKIADMCEKISPVRPDKCPPVIPDSDKTLRTICYNRAHQIYGEKLPPIVTERLERELNSIISNGFAVMYIIAQKLVWKSNADGYLVGSRGSVGSSFVATMAGITEVNPLSPHYYCEDCHYYDFDSDEVKAYSGRAGCDMPDKNCPVCGAPLRKEGFDIPFETFLGFKGNKEPDIDLNFSGDYQGNAHRYTEVIFGEGHTFRAGTVGTLADKTAFGYVKKYYEEHGQRKRTCEINRIVEGCVGVRRTTGQHPGGIIVLPHGEEIYSFTPIQHPANDTETDIITTHFDYHSIDHNLLKLDILGHDDPTMIRMLEDLTGLHAQDIPLDDKSVMSLFQSTEALGVTPEEILGCPLGSLGIPEFGTEFVIQMLQDTKPQSFSDLVRISGLSHGTDVWLGNAQTLIQEGKATISTAICTRDDIMTYLIRMGLDSELSFTIMESVRKGKGLKPEWEKEMKEHDVPDWYIWSCKKIKYMFPKAHAAAYVMMAYRIAYCKVYYPLAYYAAYFSIRASAFNYELMCLGHERLLAHMKEYKKNYDSLTKKEQDTYKDMKSVQEMYARGFEFVPIDINKADASRFQIVDGKLMPSLCSIDGLGDKAAEAVVEAVKDGPFLSKDDFWQRTKVPKSVIDVMSDLGLLGDLPETNQLSLFD